MLMMLELVDELVQKQERLVMPELVTMQELVAVMLELVAKVGVVVRKLELVAKVKLEELVAMVELEELVEMLEVVTMLAGPVYMVELVESVVEMAR